MHRSDFPKRDREPLPTAHMPAVSRRALITAAPAALVTALARPSPARPVVSKTGPYRTVQSAIDAVPARNQSPVTIEIRPGTYRERITVPRDKRLIRMVGADAMRTVLTYNLATATTAETRYTSSTYVWADDFQAENLTFE